MQQPTPAQIAHIEAHLDLFHNHAGDDRTPEEYLREYAYKGDIYERLCHDLGLNPIQESTMSQPTDDIDARIQAAVNKAMNLGREVADTVTVAAPESFEDALAAVDATDSEAALAMLNWLLKNKRVQRVGVLDGGNGYLFCYQEPKGSTKAGYKPGATKGDRIVDQAVDKQRESGAEAAERGLCEHCFSAVVNLNGTIVLDDPDNPATKCEASPTGKHSMV